MGQLVKQGASNLQGGSGLVYKYQGAHILLRLYICTIKQAVMDKKTAKMTKCKRMNPEGVTIKVSTLQLKGESPGLRLHCQNTRPNRTDRTHTPLAFLFLAFHSSSWALVLASTFTSSFLSPICSSWSSRRDRRVDSGSLYSQKPNALGSREGRRGQELVMCLGLSLWRLHYDEHAMVRGQNVKGSEQALEMRRGAV